MGARSGAQYLARLQANSPEFWFGGERVTDTTTHPSTAAAAAEIARLYDLQLDAANRERVLFPSPATGDPVSAQFLVPTTVDELARRREFHRMWAESTVGMMGRSTDFMGAILTSWYINADYFGENAERVRRYFEYIRDNDLFLTHVLIDPPVDRSKPASGQPDPYTYVGVVRETDEGIIVRGAKMFATAAPYADEMLVWPLNTRGYSEQDTRYAVAFACPTNAPGVRFIAREPYGGSNRFDHPLASRFDEMDAVAIFDDVLIPWDRVFINQDPDGIANMLKLQTLAYTGHQSSVRLMTKLQFAAGILKRATAVVKTDEFPHIRDLMGEVTTYIELVRAALISSEVTATTANDGVSLIPNIAPLNAIRNSGSRWYPRVREIYQQVLAGGLLYQPASVTILDSPVREDVDRYFRGADTTGEERIKIMNVAKDIAVSPFGARHELYERFYAGDPLALRVATQYLGYDWSEPLSLADAFLDSYNATDVLAELDDLREVAQGAR